MDQGTLGAHCTHMFSTQDQDIPQPDWDNLRFGQACTLDPPDQLGQTMGNLKTELEELCSMTNSCDYPQTNAIRAFFEKTSQAQKQLLMKSL